MKIRSSIKKMCKKCKIIKRGKTLLIKCTDPRHKQKQG